MKLSAYSSIAAVIVLLIALPWFSSSNVVISFMIYTLIIAIAAQGWNVLGGMAGQISFGHAAFFGTGAYVISLWQLNLGLGAWSGLLVGIAAGALVGWLVGFLSFRAGLRGSYFALVTLAFAEVFRVLTNASPLMGGASGLLLPINYGFEHLQFSNRTYFYWLTVAVLSVGLIVVRKISFSRFGAQLAAVRENEDAAKALGINVLRVKLKAITLSGGLAAAAGCLYVQYFLYIDASLAFGPKVSVEVLLASMVGGLGTVFGPLVGVLGLHLLGEAVKSFTGEIPGVDMAIYGGVLIVAVCFLPQGLLGLGRKWRIRSAKTEQEQRT